MFHGDGVGSESVRLCPVLLQQETGEWKRGWEGGAKRAYGRRRNTSPSTRVRHPLTHRVLFPRLQMRYKRLSNL